MNNKLYTHIGILKSASSRTDPNLSKKVLLKESAKYWITQHGLKYHKSDGRKEFIMGWFGHGIHDGDETQTCHYLSDLDIEEIAKKVSDNLSHRLNKEGRSISQGHVESVRQSIISQIKKVQKRKK